MISVIGFCKIAFIIIVKHYINLYVIFLDCLAIYWTFVIIAIISA